MANVIAAASSRRRFICRRFICRRLYRRRFISPPLHHIFSSNSRESGP